MIRTCSHDASGHKNFVKLTACHPLERHRMKVGLPTGEVSPFIEYNRVPGMDSGVVRPPSRNQVAIPQFCPQDRPQERVMGVAEVSDWSRVSLPHHYGLISLHNQVDLKSGAPYGTLDALQDRAPQYSFVGKTNGFKAAPIKLGGRDSCHRRTSPPPSQ